MIKLMRTTSSWKPVFFGSVLFFASSPAFATAPTPGVPLTKGDEARPGSTSNTASPALCATTYQNVSSWLGAFDWKKNTRQKDITQAVTTYFQSKPDLCEKGTYPGFLTTIEDFARAGLRDPARRKQKAWMIEALLGFLPSKAPKSDKAISALSAFRSNMAALIGDIQNPALTPLNAALDAIIPPVEQAEPKQPGTLVAPVVSWPKHLIDTLLSVQQRLSASVTTKPSEKIASGLDLDSIRTDLDSVWAWASQGEQATAANPDALPPLPAQLIALLFQANQSIQQEISKKAAQGTNYTRSGQLDEAEQHLASIATWIRDQRTQSATALKIISTPTP